MFFIITLVLGKWGYHQQKAPFNEPNIFNEGLIEGSRICKTSILTSQGPHEPFQSHVPQTVFE